MNKVKVKLVRSLIDRTKRQKATVRALGLKKVSSTAEHEATPQILGMIERVKHLIDVEQI